MPNTVTTSGPFFDAAFARSATKRHLRAAEDAVGREGLNRVHAVLGSVLRHPTGYYESSVVTDRATSGVDIIGDGVVYGPWLEGVGSRNKTTRFKGYFTFRRVAQQLQAAAGPIVERHVEELVRELNG